MVLGGNVLCLRSGLDQVAAPPKACVAFGLSFWIAVEATSSGTRSDKVSFCLSVTNKGKITRED